MSTWFALSLGDAMFAREALDRIADRFAAVYRTADRPDAAAAFFRHESEGRLHCEVMAYFSPPARVAAEACGAVPCPEPAPQGLSLLAGSDDSWPLLFPGFDP